jgi:mycothiol synthase
MNSPDYIIPDAPDIPGLVFRRFRGAVDLPAIVAVHRGREAHDQVDPLSAEQRTPTVEELAEVYTQRPDFSPEHQMLMVDVFHQLVGYAWIRCWAQDESTCVCYHRAHLLPEWRGKGIDTAMLRWAEDELAFIASHRPEGVSAVYRTGVASAEREAVAHLEAAGYTVANRVIEMARDLQADLPTPALPSGFELRPPTPRQYKPIFFALHETLAGEWGYIAKTADDFAAFIDDPRTDPSLWQVAWLGDTIAGVVMCEAQDTVGLVVDLGVVKAFRRRGLGRALLVHALHLLKARGFTQARIFTDAADPFGARTLYESVGFRVKTELLRYTKPL